MQSVLQTNRRKEIKTYLSKLICPSKYYYYSVIYTKQYMFQKSIGRIGDLDELS